MAHFLHCPRDPRPMIRWRTATAMAAGLLALAPAHAVGDVGAHGFDWEIGTCTTTFRVRTNPFSGQQRLGRLMPEHPW